MVLTALFLAFPALASPLRQSEPGDGLMVDVGLDLSPSVAAWLGDTGVAASVRAGDGLPAWRPVSLGVEAGRHRVLASRGVHRLHGTAAAGLVVPLVTPGLGLSVTPALRYEARGAWLSAGVGLAVPTELGFAGGFTARVPVLVEPALGLHPPGDVWACVVGSAGPVLSPGGATGVALGARAVVGWRR